MTQKKGNRNNTVAPETVYRWIADFYKKNAYMPTCAEIGEGHDRSRQWAQQMCDRLVLAGKIIVEPGTQRGIRLV